MQYFCSNGRDCISNHNLAGYTIYITSISTATLQQTWISISSSMSQNLLIMKRIHLQLSEEKEQAVSMPLHTGWSWIWAVSLAPALHPALLSISTTHLWKEMFCMILHWTVFHLKQKLLKGKSLVTHWILNSTQSLYLLSERISSVTFFPVNLCLLPILKLRVLRSRLSLREQ